MSDWFEEDAIAATWRATKGGPTHGELEAAPLLDDWELAYFLSGYTCATGKPLGHPEERDGVWFMTSAVVRVDMKREWLRTVSRYYRLGAESIVGGKIELMFIDNQVAFVSPVNDDMLEKLNARNEAAARRLAERRN